MKFRLLDWIVCPLCGAALTCQVAKSGPARTSQEASSPSTCSVCRGPRQASVTPCQDCYGLEVEDGELACGQGHRFPVVAGVPILTPGAGSKSTESESIAASFGREWAQFDYSDRTWNKSVDERCALFLKEVDLPAAALQGKTVLDAGCGNGSLSRGINRFGCEVVAADVSGSVFPAFRHFSQLGNGRTHFLQADLTRHPFRSESVDIVYSSGVLHHNPNTFNALRSVLRALKPGGTVYIWVYEQIPGVRHRLKGIFRSLVAPLPAPVKQAIMYVWLPQAMLRQYLRTLLGRNEPQDRLRWRERLVLLMDHYTPRYRWEHTQEEVHGWYRSLGLEAIRTTEEREWGFGVMARKPR